MTLTLLTVLRLLALALALVVSLSGCGGGDDDNGGETAGGDRIEGTGYSLEAPDGWNDRSDDAEDFAAGGFEPDVIVTGEREDGFQRNINVLRQPELPPGVDTESFAEQSRQALADPEQLQGLGSQLSPSDVSPISQAEVDGEPARQFEYSGKTDGGDLRFRQVYVVRDGVGYVLTYTDLPDRFAERADVVDEVLASWQWE